MSFTNNFSSSAVLHKKTMYPNLCFLLAVLVTGANSYYDFGTYCSPLDTSPSDFCDPNLYLECIDSRCQCNSSMIYNTIPKDNFFGRQCSLKLGATCPLDTSARLYCFEHADCIDVGRQDGFGVCSCKNPDLPSENGEYCIHIENESHRTCNDKSVLCNSDLQLQCNLGIQCRCMDGFQEDSGGCLLSYGSSCRTSSKANDETCAKSLECNEFGKCQCERSTERIWIPHEDSGLPRGICATKHGFNCSSFYEPCIPNADCVNDGNFTCRCGEYFEPTSDGTYCTPKPDTVLELNASCEKDNFGVVCNSENQLNCICANPNNQTDCTCQCKYPYIVNSGGRCQAGYESSCNATGANDSTTCNAEALLLCGTDNKCICQDEDRQDFHTIQKKCGLNYFEECDSSGNSVECQDPFFCRAGDENGNRCVCQPGYKPYWDYLCVPYYSSDQLFHGSDCTAWNMLEHCDASKRQDCIDSTCQCEEGTIYNSKNTNCFTQFKGECNPEESVDDGELCDFGRNLACINRTGNYLCGCEMRQQIYLEEFSSCVVHRGGNCSDARIPDFYTYDSPCVPNAYCDNGNICNCKDGFISEGYFCKSSTNFSSKLAATIKTILMAVTLLYLGW